MDVSALQRADSSPTNGAITDGEVVWSRYPDAGINVATTLTRRARDGGQKARRTREITYKT
jgi:hypothetical protein